jgi:hypothetical protein
MYGLISPNARVLNEPRYLVLIWTITWYWSPRFSIAITCAGSGVIYRRHFILPREPGSSLLLNPKDGILCHLRDPEFHDGLRGNLDLLQRLRVDAGSRFPLLLHELAEAGQDELAVLLDLLVGEARESV